MATFTAQGHRADKLVHMTWTDGEVTSDDDEQAVMVLKGLAEAREGDYVAAPPATGTTHDHLKDAWSTFALMHLVFNDTPRITYGQLPDIPPAPAGAVI